ncbi:MAG: glycosyltransferase [Myxococcales bacterium]
MKNGQRIQVLMLGWEYPPQISGGLGTACEGLTTALAPLAVDIDFVVPHLYGTERAPHMALMSSESFPPRAGSPSSGESPFRALSVTSGGEDDERPGGLRTTAIPALLSPYLSTAEYQGLVAMMERRGDRATLEYFDGFDPLPLLLGENDLASPPAQRRQASPQADTARGIHYGEDLFQEVARYAARVAQSTRERRPDVVHAHDWMTFPAATQVARFHGVPLVLHVHSLEQDRSGGNSNPTIAAIEGAGLRAATRVIAVSHYTARMIHEVHGVPLERIDVVHNGVYARRTVNAYEEAHPNRGPLVLFLGRITYQKGPEYFVEAAAKVLEKVPDARFVMAGSGDMLPRMQARVRELGIEAAFEFPGFVRGAEVEHLFSTADAYVMPSVSEPFGISALEAMSYETPVILSRQSGASEILRHALKVDFWDINKLASQIIAILSYPELRRSIVDMAREEVRRVHWEASAAKVRHVYQRALGET